MHPQYLLTHASSRKGVISVKPMYISCASHASWNPELAVRFLQPVSRRESVDLLNTHIDISKLEMAAACLHQCTLSFEQVILRVAL